MDLEEFRRRKLAFIEKHGADSIIMADETQRAELMRELEPLARMSKMPAEKLLALIAANLAQGWQ